VTADALGESPTPEAARRRWLEEVTLYLGNCLALFLPGATPPVTDAHTIEPGEVQSWPDPDLSLLIEEGRRQIDRQYDELRRVQDRSQFAFTTSLLVTTLGGFVLRKVLENDDGPALVVWLVSCLLLLFSLLGCASNLGTKNVMGSIDTVLLSLETPPTKSRTAQAYAENIAPGANTVATRLTIYRDAVFLLALSVVGFLASLQLTA